MKLFDLKNEIQRKIFINASSLIIAILAYLLISRINEIWNFLGTVMNVLYPFILGFCIAFLMNDLVIFFENRFNRFIFSPKRRRLAATATVFLLVVLFLIFSIWVILPSLADSIRNFIENISTYSVRLEQFIVRIAEQLNLDVQSVYSTLNSMNISHTITNFLQSTVSKAMSYSFDAVHFLTNSVIALAAAFYMLMDKENLLRSFRVLITAMLGRKRSSFFFLYCMDIKNVFQQFIVGNLLDSLIVGIVCAVGMIILGIPYAPMIGFVVGITNIIPVFGPFLGAIPVGFLLILIKPLYCVIFAVFILILQQIDGNVIKPIILGDKLGISGFWILFAVSVGGSLFGIPGMLLGVPVFALIYSGIEDLVDLQLREHPQREKAAFGKET